MAVLVGPIRADFDINDTQYGLIQGFYFGVIYTLLSIPIGYLADRKSRRNIIGIGVFVWSAMTCFCGFAKSFTTLCIARMGVGIGEAALSPPAHSMLSDSYDKSQLPRSLSLFTLGIPIGFGLSYIIGIKVFNLFDQGVLQFAFLEGFKSWQLTFFAVGVPGLLLALLVFTLKEPIRKTTITQQGSDSFAAAFNYVWLHKRLYFGAFFGISMLSILGYGTLSWFLEAMVRKFDADKTVLSNQFGQALIVLGSLGTIAGGWLTSYLQRKGVADAGYKMIMWVALLWLIPGIAAPLMPTADLAMLMIMPVLFLFNSYFGAAIAALYFVTPNHMRAQVSAMLLFVSNLLGSGLSPVIVGAFTDYVFMDEMKLYCAISLLTAIFAPLSALLVWWGLASYKKAQQMG